MAFDTIIDKKELESALTASANAIREKTGGTEPIAWLPDKGFAEAIGAIETGGGGSADDGWIKDGNTHVWISLKEGRTSPMLGVCPNGTVTVDWGDGTTPDVLTGTSTSTVKWTPTHNYASAGDYVITLTVDGTMGFYGNSGTDQFSGILRYSSKENSINTVYQSSVKKLEVGNGINSIATAAFSHCYCLECVFIGVGVTSIQTYAFTYCYSLTSVVIPDGVNVINNYAFQKCSALSNINIPNGVTKIENSVFGGCGSLASVTIPASVTSIESGAFSGCSSLSSVVVPVGVTSIPSSTFQNCFSLSRVIIQQGVTAIASYAFHNCYSLASVTIPASVTTIQSYAFQNCYGVRYYDFTACTAVPSLSNANAFNGIAADCEIRVPAALYDEWIASTNWPVYASQIVAGQRRE